MMRSFILSTFFIASAASSAPFLAKNEKMDAVEEGDQPHRKLSEQLFSMLLTGAGIPAPISAMAAMPLHLAFDSLLKKGIDDVLQLLRDDGTIDDNIYQHAQALAHQRIVEQALEQEIPKLLAEDGSAPPRGSWVETASNVVNNVASNVVNNAINDSNTPYLVNALLENVNNNLGKLFGLLS